MSYDRRLSSYDRRASKLSLGPARRDDKATESIKTVKLQSRNKGDLASAVISAGFHAKRSNKTMYVYLGNSYMTPVWRVSDKTSDYLDPINNTGPKIASVTPELEVSWHEVQSRTKLASSTEMKPKMWYCQAAGFYDKVTWFYAEKELENGDMEGQQVDTTGKSWKSVGARVPKNEWSIWDEVADSEVPEAVKEAL